MASKKGIELSVNFIVMLVLAIAIFIGALAFSGKFLGQLSETQTKLDAQTQQQLAALLDQGELVAIPFKTKEIARNKYDTFGLGIRASQAGTYTYTVEFVKAVTSAGDVYDSNDCEALTGGQCPIGIGGDWNIDGISGTAELEKNQQAEFLILVEVPGGIPSGNYLFKVTVDRDGTPYYFPVQFTVRII